VSRQPVIIMEWLKSVMSIVSNMPMANNIIPLVLPRMPGSIWTRAQEITLNAFKNSGFNKVRMCVLPKSYELVNEEPELYPT